MIYLIVAAFVALAAFYAWVFFSQLETPGFTWLQRWARRGWRAKLVSCPWCFGWWASLALTVPAHLSLDLFNPVVMVLSAAASAAIVAIIAQKFPADMDDFEFDE